jgi:glycerophosphoryl diester phosphodiesterase
MLRRSLVALVAAMALPASASAEPVIDERFDSGSLPAGWTPVEGEWSVADGRLVGRSSSSGQLSRLTFGPHLDNYRFEVTLRFESALDAARWTALGLDLGADGAPPWWQAALRSNTTAANGLEFAQRRADNSWNVPATAAAPSAAGVGRDVRVRVEVLGTKARLFFDGTLAMEHRVLTRSAAGGLGLVVNGSVVSFDNVRVTELDPEPLVRDGAPAVIAHRGYSSITPENTLAAMAAGARAGADWVEIDVATSADGVPYVLHDNTVDRTTDGTGALPSLSSAVLDGLDAGSWFSPALAGQPLPRFSAALDEFQRSAADLLLEIKGPETRAELERIVGLIRERGLIGRVLVQSFDEQALRDVYAIEPKLRLGLLRSTLDADPVAVARALHAVTYNPSWSALAPRKEAVHDLNRAGIAVMPYTVDDPAVWAQMRDAGVDGIITNKAGMLVGWNAAAAAPGIKAPADGAELTRGDVVSLAFSGEGAATLDGKPIAEGDPIRADDLSLGRHVLAVGPARTTFTVAPTARGIAHLVAVAPGVPDRLRPRLLALALDRSWDKLLREARKHRLGEPLIGDLEALR